MTFKEIIESYGKQLAYSCTVQHLTTEIPLSEEDIISINPHFDGALYTSVMRCLDVVLEGDHRNIQKGYFIRNNKFTVKKDSDEKTINYGTYIVAEAPEYDDRENSTKFICYDLMFTTMQEYKLIITYPITVKTYLEKIAEACGFTIANIGDLRNADKLISEEKYLNVANDEGSTYTYRDVLDDIARCTGCSLAFKSDANGENVDELYIVYVTDGNGNMKTPLHTLDISNFKTLTIGEKYGPVNSVVFSRQPQEDNVYLMNNGITDKTALSVKFRQPLIAEGTDEERLAWLPEILKAVRGTQYQCYSLDSFGIGYLNFGDVFKIKAFARNGLSLDYSQPEEYLTVFMRSDMLINGDVKESTKLEMPVATSTDYKAGTTEGEKRLLEAYMQVDKKLGLITAIVSDPQEGLATKVEQSAAAITTLLKKTTAIETAGYITESAAQSLIDASARNITLAVSESLKQANKNLFIDSECFESATVNAFRSEILQDKITTDEALPLRKVRQIGFWGNATSYPANIGFTLSAKDIIGQEAGKIDKLKAGVTYALSFKAKCTQTENDLSLVNFLYVGQGIKVQVASNSSFTLKNEWQDFTIVFSLSGNPTDFSLRFFVNTDSQATSYAISFSSFMLVEGETPADWDVAKAIEQTVEQSVEAKLDLYVKTDENGNLVSAIHAKANQFTVESDNFILDGKGNMTCNNANITGGTINIGNNDMGIFIAADGTLTQKYKAVDGEINLLKMSMSLDLDSVLQGVHTYSTFELDGGFILKNNTYGETAIFESGGSVLFPRANTKFWADDRAKINNFNLLTTEWSLGEVINPAPRHMIQADGGFVLSANGGENALILQGSSLWLCGKLYFGNYKNIVKTKMPLYVNPDGEITV